MRIRLCEESACRTIFLAMFTDCSLRDDRFTAKLNVIATLRKTTLTFAADIKNTNALPNRQIIIVLQERAAFYIF